MYYTYGANYSIPSAYRLGSGNVFFLNFNKILTPSRYVHFADTVYGPSHANFPNQAFIFTNLNNKRIHMRHQEMANCWFIDAHVELSQEQKLQEYGITGVYKENYQEVNF
jgi:prepilin-type processing-associated H-X9-DG protein